MMTCKDVISIMYYPCFNSWAIMTFTYECYLLLCHMSEIAHDMIIDGNY